jgi:hypothetical protein
MHLTQVNAKEIITMTSLNYSVTEPALRSPVEEWQPHGKQSESTTVLSRLSPLRDEQEQLIRWYVAGTDIEDRKQAEQRLQNENVALREEIDKASMFEEIVGTSPTLQTVLSRITKVARRDRNGEGTCRPRHSQTLPTLFTRLRECELRSRPARADRVRIVWPREGLFYGCDAATFGSL